MRAWHEELGTLEGRVAELREIVPTAEADVSEHEVARDVAHSAPEEAQRNRDYQRTAHEDRGLPGGQHE